MHTHTPAHMHTHTPPHPHICTHTHIHTQCTKTITPFACIIHICAHTHTHTTYKNNYPIYLHNSHMRAHTHTYTMYKNNYPIYLHNSHICTFKQEVLEERIPYFYFQLSNTNFGWNIYYYTSNPVICNITYWQPTICTPSIQSFPLKLLQ